MSCLEVLPRNRRKSLWKMVKSIFFGQKTVSKVHSIHKRAIVKRRSTFERPSSSYVYPVVERTGNTRLPTSSSEEDITIAGTGTVLARELSICMAPNNEDLNETQNTVNESRVGHHHIITLAHLEIDPGVDNDEQLQESSSTDILNAIDESEEFRNSNSPVLQPTIRNNFVNSHNRELEETNSCSASIDEILELFDETVRLEKSTDSCIIRNLDDSQNNPTLSSQEISTNTNETAFANAPESSIRRRPNGSQSLAIGINSEQGTCSQAQAAPERRKSYVEVSRIPPITLSYIPSGLKIEDKVVWISENGPENGTVRWIGKIREQFYAGVELEKPIGNSSGLYGYGPGLFKRLFTCKLSYGKFIPVKELVLHTDYHDNGLKAGIICIICRDDFLETWEPCPDLETANDFGKMVATKNCGHLFHAGCLTEWFSKKNYDLQPCPYCQIPMNRNDVIRIFPAEF